MKRKERIEKLLEKLGANLYEREDILAKCLLAALSGESVFMYGPPGTAKSLIARRVACAFAETGYFECLMNRFTTPEELFGPVSLKALKEDRYLRKTENCLPEAEFAFLDEIWKAGPGILNTLLTILNERKFRNDGTVCDVPLKGIVAASNETPAQGQGLEALYDRFAIRLKVEPLKKKDNFMTLLGGDRVQGTVKVEKELAFDENEWTAMMGEIDKVKFSEDACNIIHAVRKAIEDYNSDIEKKKNTKKTRLYVSDRRWQKIARVLKTAAYLCDRDEVLPVDTAILASSLWSDPSQQTDVQKMVEDAMRENSIQETVALDEWEEEVDSRETIINETLYHSANKYETKTINGVEYFEVSPQGSNTLIYIRADKLGTSGSHGAVDQHGSQLSDWAYTFNGSETCSITHTIYYGQSQDYRFEPKKIFKAGDRKCFSPKVKNELQKDISLLEEKREEIERAVNQRISEVRAKNATPFVSEAQQKLLIAAQSEILERLGSGRMRLERIKQKIDNHING
ncbi:MAG: AAA family ATPase [Kiritimatiellae bacterium]|nr:AAA family ATPase [Kiritimatiellia bacterium]